MNAIPLTKNESLSLFTAGHKKLNWLNYLKNGFAHCSSSPSRFHFFFLNFPSCSAVTKERDFRRLLRFQFCVCVPLTMASVSALNRLLHESIRTKTVRVCCPCTRLALSEVSVTFSSIVAIRSASSRLAGPCWGMGLLGMAPVLAVGRRSSSPRAISRALSRALSHSAFCSLIIRRAWIPSLTFM